MPPTLDSPEVVALRATIDLLTKIVYAETAGIVAVCGFFVAWVRTLYDARLTQGTADLKDRDALLERVLTACTTLASAMKTAAKKGGDE